MTEIVLPLASYPDGETAIAEVSVPNSATVLRIAALRCTAVQSDVWPDTATFARISTEIDLGQGYGELQNGSVEGWGGIQQNKFHVDIPEMWCSVQLPAGTGRKIRGTLLVTDGPWRSEGSFEFFD